MKILFFVKGIETDDGVMTKMLKCNTTIPTKRIETFPLTRFKIDNSQINIKIFEGEHSMTRDNHLLGDFQLSVNPITVVPSDEPTIEITFVIDANSILIVTATDKIYGNENEITITNDNGHLSKDEIERMIADAEIHKKEDEILLDRIATQNSLESYCFNIKERINDENFKHKIDDYDKKKILDIIEDTLTWLEAKQVRYI
jgi:L1 cell adhesion molecule like protein